MKWLYVASGLLSLSILSTCVSSAQARNDHAGVMVFTASHLPPVMGQMHEARVFYLDGADAAMKRLRFANPRNPAQAKAQASAMLQTPQGQAAIAKVTEVGQGIALAWQHGIEKLPAVMVGGTHVVYGVFDVDEAVKMIEKAQTYAF